jgi:hypothetical protein
MVTIRKARDSKAAAEAFIERGEKLHDAVEKDLEAGDGGCTVSKSLPWLVLWMVEYTLLKVRQNGGGAEPQTTLECGPLKITSNSVRDLTRVAAVCALVWYGWRQHQLHGKVEKMTAIPTRVEMAGPPPAP